MAIQFKGIDLTPNLKDALHECFYHLFSFTDLNPLHVAIDIAAALGLGPLAGTDGAQALHALQLQQHVSTMRPGDGMLLPAPQPIFEPNAETRYCPTEFNPEDLNCWPLTPIRQSLETLCSQTDTPNATVEGETYAGTELYSYSYLFTCSPSYRVAYNVVSCVFIHTVRYCDPSGNWESPVWYSCNTGKNKVRRADLHHYCTVCVLYVLMNEGTLELSFLRVQFIQQ